MPFYTKMQMSKCELQLKCVAERTKTNDVIKYTSEAGIRFNSLAYSFQKPIKPIQCNYACTTHIHTGCTFCDTFMHLANTYSHRIVYI